MPSEPRVPPPPPPPPPVPPPPPPPVPPAPETGPAPAPPPPPAPGAFRAGSVRGILAGVVAVSLLANVVLAARIADTNADLDAARGQIARLDSEIDRLRDRLAERQSSGSPIDRVMEAVAKIRSLEFERKVDAEILSEEALRKRVLDEIGKSDERAQIEATDKVLTTLGLLEPNADLYRILVDVHTEQVGGFYDTQTAKLVVLGSAGTPKPLDRYLLAHELTHAVTDQHFDLSRIDELQEARHDDQATAFLALVEGDATVVMDVYRDDYLSRGEQDEVERGLRAAPATKFLAAPAIVQQSLLFPYEAGRQFVRALLARGGYALVDKAYQDPPVSTEQILHPAKYLAARRDTPRDVTLPDLAAAMGSAWKKIDGGGIGEIDVRFILDEYVNRADAVVASEGWDGGAYVAVESGAGTLVAASTLWDSDTEAREALRAFERWIQERFRGRGSAYRVDGGRGWEAPTGTAAVVRQGDKVFLIVGPDRSSVEKARSAIGASGTSA